MPTNTYVALATQTVATATPTVTFSSIPSGYTDLVVVVNGGLSATNQSFRFQVGNGTIDTGNNYSYTYMAGNGSSASSSRVANTSGFNAYHVAGQSDANIKNNVILHYQNYSNTTTNKTILCRGNSDLETAATVALWRSTAAINTILVGTTSGNLVAGTTISIYGVAAASVGAKATGGTIYSDSSYYYHVFAANGTFTPTQSISADVLVVAGGGGGGGGGSTNATGGGGGAGGLLYFGSQSLTATNYTCTVGAGGNAGSGYTASQASNGVDSQFGALTLVKGGSGAAGWAVSTPTVGGSGSGGPGYSQNASRVGTAGTAGQGSNGGTGYNDGSAGGGGGAGAAGGNSAPGNSSPAGTGGNGLATYSSWGVATNFGESISGTYYFAGGGSGGAGYTGAQAAAGYGGGGQGGSNANTNGTSARANTGGGGGGAGAGNAGGATSGGNGGSGIVIVRYAR